VGLRSSGWNRPDEEVELMSLPVASLDEELLDAGYLVDPYPVYARLREEDPVHWSEAWDCWIITRYKDVVGVLREDGKKFSVYGRAHRSVSALPSSMHKEMAPVLQHYESGLLHSDPPDHTRLRRLINNAFTPRSVEAMRPGIVQLVTELLDALRGRERFTCWPTSRSTANYGRIRRAGHASRGPLPDAHLGS
jgi:cytochrome P450